MNVASLLRGEWKSDEHGIALEREVEDGPMNIASLMVKRWG